MNIHIGGQTKTLDERGGPGMMVAKPHGDWAEGRAMTHRLALFPLQTNGHVGVRRVAQRPIIVCCKHHLHTIEGYGDAASRLLVGAGTGHGTDGKVTLVT